LFLNNRQFYSHLLIFNIKFLVKFVIGGGSAAGFGSGYSGSYGGGAMKSSGGYSQRGSGPYGGGKLTIILFHVTKLLTKCKRFIDSSQKLYR